MRRERRSQKLFLIEVGDNVRIVLLMVSRIGRPIVDGDLRENLDEIRKLT